MMGPLEKIGMVLIVCGLVVCAISMFFLQDVAALKKTNKRVVFTPGKIIILLDSQCSFLFSYVQFLCMKFKVTLSGGNDER